MARRSVCLAQGKGYYVPEGTEDKSMLDVITHLDKARPVYTLLYFTAKWNPQCAKIEQDYENLCASHASFHHIRVDCDKHPKVKRFFDARVEPQFLVLVNGGEMTRITGFNFEKIGATLEKVQKINQDGTIGYYGDSKHTWERFYDDFDKFSRYGEERDGFRAQIETNSDNWRGPGTDKP